MSRDSQKGWFGSLLFHGVLLALLVLLHIPEILPKEDLIELSWGAVTSPSSEVRSAPSLQATSSSAKEGRVEIPSRNKPASQPVELPKRNFRDLSPESVPLARTEKLAPSEAAPQEGENAVSSVGEREAVSEARLGERDQIPTVDQGRGAPGAVPASGGGTPGGDVREGVTFSIQWMEGGTRRKLSGDLPGYPSGETIEAQIKILAVVRPDGSVRSVQPTQKANTRLEDAAMKAIRLWRFEALRSNQPSVDQNCVITFLFTLR